MTLALLALLVGGALLYAGIKGISVQRALLGDNRAIQPNQQLSGS